jgi:hypothetical protein
MIDAQCDRCGHQRLDFLIKGDGYIAPCEQCGGSLTRTHIDGFRPANAVSPDDIPGGVWIKHGICNEDGTPKKYYSRSSMKAAADARGLVNYVTHETDNVIGTDKNKFTTRWVGLPPGLTQEEEDARRRHWHEDEQRLQRELAEKGSQCEPSTVITTVTD